MKMEFSQSRQVLQKRLGTEGVSKVGWAALPSRLRWTTHYQIDTTTQYAVRSAY